MRDIKHFWRAYSVHMLTATGVIFGFLAMLSATEAHWGTMYIWLVIALIVDGIDGPLARKFDVKKYAPQWDGHLMDLIIDYLTYVFIPAFALFKSGLLSGWTGWVTTGAICFTAVIYFADTRMKTKDYSFSGFPACWNMFVLVMFALKPNFWVIFALAMIFCAAQFTHLKFIHPVRTKRWRKVSLPMAILWVIFAGWAAWHNFEIGPICMTGITITSLYLALAGIFQQIFPAKDTPATS